MRSHSIITLASLLCICSGMSALADDDPCADALVKSTFNMHSSRDFRLATLVSHDLWKQTRIQEGASAVIYGVPVGESYDDFHGRAEHELNLLNESERDVYNVAWTGLDSNSVTAYEKCLDSQASARGPHLGVVAADQFSITIKVTWNNPGAGPTGASWQSAKYFADLPNLVAEGSHKYTIRRPNVAMNLSWNSAHDTSETITLEPLPPAPQQTPEVRYLQLGSCRGNGGVTGVWFWGPPSRSCNGIPTWGSYNTDVKTTVTRIGSCKGHGGVEGVTLYGPEHGDCAGMRGAWLTYENGHDISADGLGFCLGQGNVVGGQILWGPVGAPCGGMIAADDRHPWGDYEAVTP